MNELQEITRLGQSRISTHLGLLSDCDLVRSRREGKRTFYKLNPQADTVASEFIQLAIRGAKELAEHGGDQINLKRILKRRREQARVAEAARRARLVATARFTTQSVDPFDVLHLDPVKPRGWDKGRQLTEKQRALLAKQGINPDDISFSQGKQLIAEIFRRWDGKLCSFKQAKVLRKYGYETEVSFAEASATIDALARNGWRRVEPAVAPAKGDPAWN